VGKLCPIDLTVPEAVLTSLQVVGESADVGGTCPRLELARSLPEAGDLLRVPFCRAQQNALPVLEKGLGFTDERQAVTGRRTSGLFCVDQLRHGMLWLAYPAPSGHSEAAAPSARTLAAAGSRSAPVLHLPRGPRRLRFGATPVRAATERRRFGRERSQGGSLGRLFGTNSQDFAGELFTAQRRRGAMVRAGWPSQRTA
jgi:hypothetical protein